jgi:hypothetical protein
MRSTKLERYRPSACSRRVAAGATTRLIATTAIIAGLLVSATPADASSGNSLQATSHGPAIDASRLPPDAPARTANNLKPPKPLHKVLKAAGKSVKRASGRQRQVERGRLALRSTSSAWKYLGHTGGYPVGNALVGSVAHYWTGQSNGYSYVVMKRYYCDLRSCTHQSSYWAEYLQGKWWGWYQYCFMYNSICIPTEFPIP